MEREQRGEADFVVEEAIGSLRLDGGIVCWGRRQRSSAVKAWVGKAFMSDDADSSPGVPPPSALRLEL